MPGFPELVLILVILFIVFGATHLPAVGEALGRTVNNFRRARHSRDDIEVSRIQPPEAADLPAPTPSADSNKKG